MSDYRKKILNIDQALALRKKLKGKKKCLVFTNGCFDLLHPGHLRYLDEARSLGDFLIIGLNSDQSIRALKGPERPICPLEVRAEMLAGLQMVDAIISFDEETPIKLIKALLPDILVKGGDWDSSNIVGAQEVLGNGGQVKSLLLADGFSSTALIERIKERKA